jgi:TfoX/Sxy family transcriptional regulator of competence genes
VSINPETPPARGSSVIASEAKQSGHVTSPARGSSVIASGSEAIQSRSVADKPFAPAVKADYSGNTGLRADNGRRQAMASTADFIDYICEQIQGVGTVRARKMFGEYMVYVNDKPILLVCDNTVFVKQLDVLADILADADRGFPYDGAREHYVLDIDDAERAREVIALMLPVTAVPKPKKKAAKQ